jgi:hypothetical protein
MDVFNIGIYWYIESSLVLNASPLCNWSWCLLILAGIHDISLYFFVSKVIETLFLWCASSYSMEIDLWRGAKRVMVCKKTQNSFRWWELYGEITMLRKPHECLTVKCGSDPSFYRINLVMIIMSYHFRVNVSYNMHICMGVSSKECMLVCV